MPVSGPLAGARPESGGVDFPDLLRRRWSIVLVGLILGIGGGYAAGTQQAPVYTSATHVLVLPTDPSDEINLDTEAQLVTSLRTAERAAALAEIDAPPADLADQVEITVPPNSEVLKITFSADTPEAAQRGAAAFADAYLTQRAESADAARTEWIAALREQISDLREGDMSPQAVEALERELALRQAAPIRAGEVISPATLPTAPSSPNSLLFPLSGLVAGLLAGLGGALIAQRVDQRVVRPTDLPTDLQAQVAMDAPGRGLEPALTAPTTALGRRYTQLRTTVVARAVPPPADRASLWLICTPRGSAAGVVTANLVAALARAGHRVVAVTSDPDSPLPTILGVPRNATAGLAGALANTAPITGLLSSSPAVPGVSVLPSGDLSTMVELPTSRAEHVLSQLRSHADYVVLETRPLERTPEAVALGATASAVVLVMEKRRTRRGEAHVAGTDLTRVGAPLVAVALVPTPRPAPGSVTPSTDTPPVGTIRARATVVPSAATAKSDGERPA